MSISDNFSTSSSDGNRFWLKPFKTVWRTRRKGQRKHRPPVIQLPDSAVAATTTAGYRHISISIPLRHSYLVPPERWLDPDHEPMVENLSRELDSRLGLDSASKAPRSGEQGVVTIPKPVAESPVSLSSNPTEASHGARAYVPQPASTQVSDRGESSARNMTAGGAQYSYDPWRLMNQIHDTKSSRSPTNVGSAGSTGATQTSGPIVIVSKLTPAPAQRIRGIIGRKRYEENNRSDPSHSTRPGQSRLIDRPQRPRGGPLSSNPSLVFNPPERRASRQLGLHREVPQSIASMLSSSTPQKTPEDNNGGTTNNDRSLDYPLIRDLATESMYTAGSEPGVRDTEAAEAYHDAPVVVPSQSHHNTAHPDVVNLSLEASGVVSRSVQTDISAMSPIFDKLGRKEKMRHRKHRNINRVKKGRPKRKHMAPLHSLNPATVNVWHASPAISRFSDVETSRTVSRQSEHPDAIETSKNQPDVPIYLPSKINHDPRISRASLMTGTLSSSESLLTANDQDSDILRLEELEAYNMTHTRKAQRATEDLAREVRILDLQTRQELLQRYDNLKESRQRELERRLRHLERNTDIFFRSIVPLIESLNRRLEKQYEIGDWQPHMASSTVRAERPQTLTSLDNRWPRGRGQPNLQHVSGAHNQTPPTPRSSALQEAFEADFIPRRGVERRQDLLDDAAYEQGDSTADQVSNNLGRESNSRHSHAPELEALEPLMRELQGAAASDFERVGVEPTAQAEIEMQMDVGSDRGQPGGERAVDRSND